MANSFIRKIVQEGPRNAIVRLTGILDSADALENPCIQLADFQNNDVNCYLVGLRVDRIEWSMSQGLEVQFFWDGVYPEQIVPIAGRGKMEMKGNGGFKPNQLAAGYNGNIIMNTNGFVPGTIANFSILIEMVKQYSTFAALPLGAA